jgi:hypothetical protein
MSDDIGDETGRTWTDAWFEPEAPEISLEIDSGDASGRSIVTVKRWEVAETLCVGSAAALVTSAQAALTDPVAFELECTFELMFALEPEIALEIDPVLAFAPVATPAAEPEPSAGLTGTTTVVRRDVPGERGSRGPPGGGGTARRLEDVDVDVDMDVDAADPRDCGRRLGDVGGADAAGAEGAAALGAAPGVGAGLVVLLACGEPAWSVMAARQWRCDGCQGRAVEAARCRYRFRAWVSKGREGGIGRGRGGENNEVRDGEKRVMEMKGRV